MVWSRDSRQGVWARVGLYPDLPVTGLAVTRLALSRTSVWALALSGQVYRRTGLSSTDWLGDSWQAVSGWESYSRAVDLSVGQCDTVWTVGQCGDIRQLEVRETQVSPPLDTDLSLTEDTDWTTIQ